MIFHKKKGCKFKKMIKKFKINVNNYCIKQADEFKYVGVIVDNKLNWHKHIEYLCTHVSKAAGVIYRLKPKLPNSALKLVYHSLISSKLRYGAAAWGSAKSTALRKLNVLNNKAVKNFKRASESLSSTYHRMNFFTCGSLYDIETAKFMFSLKEGKLPEEFSHFVEPISHNHYTRATAQEKYKLPQPRTDLGKSSIKFQGVKVWNNLPTYIRKEKNRNSFNKNLKSYLLQQQSIN